MKVNLVTIHDRLTIKLTDGQKNLNLTVSRKGETASGKGQTEQTLRFALDAFGRYLKTKTNGANYGEQLANLKIKAEQAKTFDEFITLMNPSEKNNPENKPMIYQINTLDVLDDEINDEHETNDAIELPENPSVQNLCKALRNCKRMNPNHRSKYVSMQEDGEDYIVSYKGKKRLRLRLVVQ